MGRQSRKSGILLRILARTSGITRRRSRIFFRSLNALCAKPSLEQTKIRKAINSVERAIPIRLLDEPHAAPDAADGQLGGIIKFYREWRISGDTAWLRRWWPKIRASLDYCIRTWDPRREGLLEEPHINTYDIQFWGADSMCMSLYAGALKAAVLMGTGLGENVDAYSMLLTKFPTARSTFQRRVFHPENIVEKSACPVSPRRRRFSRLSRIPGAREKRRAALSIRGRLPL